MSGTFILQIEDRLERETWYRILEREKKRTKLTFKVGDHIIFPRYIVRAGYLWEPNDCPWDVQFANAKRMLMEEFNKKMAPFRKFGTPVEKARQIDMKMIEVLLEVLDTDEKRVPSASSL